MGQTSDKVPEKRAFYMKKWMSGGWNTMAQNEKDTRQMWWAGKVRWGTVNNLVYYSGWNTQNILFRLCEKVNLMTLIPQKLLGKIRSGWRSSIYRMTNMQLPSILWLHSFWGVLPSNILVPRKIPVEISLASNSLVCIVYSLHKWEHFYLINMMPTLPISHRVSGI